MSEFKRYDSQKSTTYFGVMLIKDPVVKQDGKLLELTWVDTSRNERYLESIFTTATFRVGDKRNEYVLARLRKGDKITITGPTFARLFVKGEGKAKQVCAAQEMPYPEKLICDVSLKDREVADFSLGGGKDGGGGTSLADNSPEGVDDDIPF
jgi:hypothetical protein